jgi:hypothetical protein
VPTVLVVDETPVAFERVPEAARDFSERRAELWPDAARRIARTSSWQRAEGWPAMPRDSAARLSAEQRSTETDRRAGRQRSTGLRCDSGGNRLLDTTPHPPHGDEARNRSAGYDGQAHEERRPLPRGLTPRVPADRFGAATGGPTGHACALNGLRGAAALGLAAQRLGPTRQLALAAATGPAHLVDGAGRPALPTSEMHARCVPRSTSR